MLRHKALLLLVAMTLAVGSLPLSAITGVAPAERAKAMTCWFDGNSWHCDDGSTVAAYPPRNPPPPTPDGAPTITWCTWGQPDWIYPRNTGYPNAAKTTSTSIRAEEDAWFYENLRRTATAARRLYTQTFFMQNSLWDFAGMFLGFRPSTKAFDFALLSQQTRTDFPWNEIQSRVGTVEGQILAHRVRIPPEQQGGNTFTSTLSLTTNYNAVVAAIYGSAGAPKVMPVSGRLPSGTQLGLDVVNSLSTDPWFYFSWNGQGLAAAPRFVRDALSASWVSYSGRKYPYEVMVRQPGEAAFSVVASADQAKTWLPGSVFYVRAIFQNRVPAWSSQAALYGTYRAWINNEMTRPWTASRPFYYYPVFVAPANINETRQGGCGNDSNNLLINSVKITTNATSWIPGSWNNCKTVGMNSTPLYKTSPQPGAFSTQEHCWLWIIKRPLDPPKLDPDSWTRAVQGKIVPLDFGPTIQTVQIGSAPQPLVSTVSVPSNGSNVSFATPLGTTEFNLTMIGFTAELPGVCSDILAPGVGKTVTLSNGDQACELVATRAAPYQGRAASIALPPFARTALSRLQDDDCVTAYKSGATTTAAEAQLLAVCGIVYNATTKSWDYRVVIHTWWDGMYKTDAIAARGLFDANWVNFPSSVDRAKIQAWRGGPPPAGFDITHPQGPLRISWPDFGPSYPMYYAYKTNVSPPNDVPWIDITVTQGQSVGG